MTTILDQLAKSRGSGYTCECGKPALFRLTSLDTPTITVAAPCSSHMAQVTERELRMRPALIIQDLRWVSQS